MSDEPHIPSPRLRAAQKLTADPGFAPSVHEGTALKALQAERREQIRNELLSEIDAWLLDQAEADDVDGAEYDADLCRKIARDLAEHFTP